MYIVIKRVRVFPDVAAGIMIALDKSPVKYFISRSVSKNFSISNGLSSFTTDNIFTGPLPKRMVIGFITNSAFSGAKDEDPFEFKDFTLNYLACYIDGNQVPSVAYTPDFENDLYMREFVSLYRYINQDEGIPQCDIKYKDYKNCVLFAFDLSPDGCVGAEAGTLSLVRRGNIRAEVRFKKTLEKAITMVVFAQFDNLIQIDKYRNVSLDY